MYFKIWISACRPRTLFLAASSVIMGSGLAIRDNHFDMAIFLLALALAMLLQTLANLANDLGDYLKGADVSGHRVGPTRATQSGLVSVKQMKVAIGIVIASAAVVGVMLLGVSILLHNTSWMFVFALLQLGVFAILAALFYTLGRRPYGYCGLGDLFSFLFFGPIPVIGTYILHGGMFGVQPLIISFGVGFISAMILNINNMRDIESDRISNKNTVASYLGLKRSKIYHAIMQFMFIICFIIYSVLYQSGMLWYHYLYFIAFIPQLYILKNIIRSSGGRELDPYLKLTSVTGFLFTVLFVLSINI